MMAKKPDPKRAERMVDFGTEELNITFDLGLAPTKEEIEKVRRELGESEEE